MKEIIVLAEHRRGELRDVTWEMLSKGRQLAEGIGRRDQCRPSREGGEPFGRGSERESQQGLSHRR